MDGSFSPVLHTLVVYQFSMPYVDGWHVRMTLLRPDLPPYNDLVVVPHSAPVIWYAVTQFAVMRLERGCELYPPSNALLWLRVPSVEFPSELYDVSSVLPAVKNYRSSFMASASTYCAFVATAEYFTFLGSEVPFIPARLRPRS